MRFTSTFDIKFDPNRWFDFDFPGGKWREATIGPKEGSLQLNEIQNLQPFLEPFTTTKRLLLYFGAMHSMINKFSLNSNAIYEGSFVDLIELMKEKKEDAPPNMSPELWWPEDRQWFVYSDYDVVVSIVGGPKRLIDELAKSKILECIPVRYEDINLVQRGWGIL